jgi:hypothetical protein
MGLRLVRELVKELYGEVTLFREYAPGDGDAPSRSWTIAEARFPLPVASADGEDAEEESPALLSGADS